MLSPTVEDYLKAIYLLQSEPGGEGKATTQALAERMEVSAASATNMVKRLARMKLLRHTPYHGVELTKAGEKIALEVIRHHRLAESYLAEALGMGWDQVHAEAEKFEHILSEDLEERMAQSLGHPKVDPHGDPIPSKEGVITRVQAQRLSDLKPGITGTIARVESSDPQRLRYLASLGLVPQANIEIMGTEPFEGPITLRTGGEKRIVGHTLAQGIFVTPTGKG